MRINNKSSSSGHHQPRPEISWVLPKRAPTPLNFEGIGVHWMKTQLRTSKKISVVPLHKTTSLQRSLQPSHRDSGTRGGQVAAVQEPRKKKKKKDSREDELLDAEVLPEEAAYMRPATVPEMAGGRDDPPLENESKSSDNDEERMMMENIRKNEHQQRQAAPVVFERKARRQQLDAVTTDPNEISVTPNDLDQPLPLVQVPLSSNVHHDSTTDLQAATNNVPTCGDGGAGSFFGSFWEGLLSSGGDDPLSSAYHSISSSINSSINNNNNNCCQHCMHHFSFMEKTVEDFAFRSACKVKSTFHPSCRLERAVLKKQKTEVLRQILKLGYMREQQERRLVAASRVAPLEQEAATPSSAEQQEQQRDRSWKKDLARSRSKSPTKGGNNKNKSNRAKSFRRSRSIGSLRRLAWTSSSANKKDDAPNSTSDVNNDKPTTSPATIDNTLGYHRGKSPPSRLPALTEALLHETDRPTSVVGTISPSGLVKRDNDSTLVPKPRTTTSSRKGNKKQDPSYKNSIAPRAVETEMITPSSSTKQLRSNLLEHPDEVKKKLGSGTLEDRNLLRFRRTPSTRSSNILKYSSNKRSKSQSQSQSRSRSRSRSRSSKSTRRRGDDHQHQDEAGEHITHLFAEEDTAGVAGKNRRWR